MLCLPIKLNICTNIKDANEAKISFILAYPVTQWVHCTHPPRLCPFEFRGCRLRSPNRNPRNIRLLSASKFCQQWPTSRRCEYLPHSSSWFRRQLSWRVTQPWRRARSWTAAWKCPYCNSPSRGVIAGCRCEVGRQLATLFPSETAEPSNHCPRVGFDCRYRNILTRSFCKSTEFTGVPFASNWNLRADHR